MNPTSAAPCEPDVQLQISELRRATLRMSDAVERLTRLEERHAGTATAVERAFAAISKQNDRIATLERSAPVQALAASWVTGAVCAVAGAVGMAVLNRVLSGGVL